MDVHKTRELVESTWDETIVPTISEYILIPNKSPMFDPDWVKNGHMAKAVDLIQGWCSSQAIEGMKVEVHQLEGRTPVILMEIPGDADDTVLLYGHLDKQPEMVGWEDGLDPWKPVLRGDKLYGRGGADDGYAAFASLTAIRAVRDQGLPHARLVVLIEACEESGSYDLPAYIDSLKDRIGSPSLVVCLDSGCANYDQMWCTTSLRGMSAGDLRVEVLTEGVHSGDASGIVPSSFRILRQLIDRVEDVTTGRILVDELHTEIPADRREQAAKAAAMLNDEVFSKFPWQGSTRAVTDDPAELILNRTWRPTLSVTGMEGVPALKDAGNVLRPYTSVKLSMRLSPAADHERATEAMRAVLEKDPPYGCMVSFKTETGASGWNAPSMSPWLSESLSSASQNYFGRDAAYMGEGGSIPFMGMLGEKFPKAQFVITGVLGPKSNAHGPNEFLHIPTGKRLTCCVAQVIVDHHAASA